MKNIDHSKKRFEALKVKGAHEKPVSDWIVAEAPLQININGKPYTVTMRTPGNDRNLVRGLLYTENIYRGREPLDVRLLDEKEIASVWINPDDLRHGYFQSRSMLSVSSCGICGKRELEDIEIDEKPLNKKVSLDPSLIQKMFEAMQLKQTTFLETGGAHAAACFDIDGNILAIQEDLGRHNAVDKVIGALLENGKLDNASCLLVSGRISFEIVSKCFRSGIQFLAAVSSPSSMSIETAEELGITLMGFCRGESLTCYAHSDRITAGILYPLD